MSPAPTTRTRAPTSVPSMREDQRPAACSRAKCGRPRCAASVAATAHSAVAAVCAPRALHSTTPSGSRPMNRSAPALCSCTRRSRGRPARKPLSGTNAARAPGTHICAPAAAPCGAPSAGSARCVRTRGDTADRRSASRLLGTMTSRGSPGARTSEPEGVAGTAAETSSGSHRRGRPARTVSGVRRASARMARLLAALALGAALAGCGTDGYQQAGPWKPLPEGNPPEVGPPTDSPPAPAPGQPADPGSGQAAAGDPDVVATDLNVPTGLVVLPDGSAVVGERETGRLVHVFPDRSPAQELMTVPGVDTAGDGGLLGLALSPTYPEDGLLYAYLSTATDNRVVRFPLGGTPNPVLTGIPRGETHNGGGLVFGTDGTLFVGTGDTGDPALAADPNSLAGKVLHIDTFGRPVGATAVYSRGHRDVTAICQSVTPDAAGTMYATDASTVAADDLDVITQGGDF